MADTHTDDENRIRRRALRAARVVTLGLAMTGLTGCFSAHDQIGPVEVRRDAAGRPSLRLHGRAAEEARRMGVTGIHVSLSHQPGVAVAVVVLAARMLGLF